MPPGEAIVAMDRLPASGTKATCSQRCLAGGQRRMVPVRGGSRSEMRCSVRIPMVQGLSYRRSMTA